MVRKMRQNLSPLYNTPEKFWDERLKSVQAYRNYAFKRQNIALSKKRMDVAKFWREQIVRLDKRIAYLQKRKVNARSPSGLLPNEIAERWAKVMTG